MGEDPSSARADETIGYVVFEAGTASLGNYDFEATLGTDTIKGMSNGATSYDFAAPGPGMIPVLSAAGMDGNNGGWPVLRGATLADSVSETSALIGFEEDQAKDSERSHTTEQVAMVALTPIEAPDPCGEDGCSPDDCVLGFVAPGVIDDSVYISNEADLTQLSDVWCVTGGVHINAPELTSLSSLSSLQAIGFDLNISNNSNLTSLAGLENLQKVETLYIDDNAVLSDISALANLSQAMSLNINNNPELVACAPWELAKQVGYSECAPGGYGCQGNLGAGSCGALPADFICEPGASGVGVYDGSLFVDDYFVGAEWGGLTCATGGLHIYSTSLTDLTSLPSSLQMVGFDLNISNNSNLTSLAGLENLQKVETLYIDDNAVLSDISALANLSQAMSLNINNNPELVACAPWELAKQVGYSECAPGGYGCQGNLGAGSCGALPADFICEPGASGVGVYDGSLFVDDYFVGAEWGGLTCATGGLHIYSTSLTDLTSLPSSLQMVGFDLNISNNSNLTSLAGLENLQKVETLYIDDNAVLSDISALANLSQAMSLNINNNPELVACAPWELAKQVGYSECAPGGYGCQGNLGAGSCGALPADFICEPGASGVGVYDGSLFVDDYFVGAEWGGLTCATGGLHIHSTSLTDLTSLPSSLQMVGFDLNISNNSNLTSLAGLENLQKVETLYIDDNAVLSDISALANLSQAMSLNINNNPELAQCAATALAEQVGQSCEWCGGNNDAGVCN